MPFQALESSVKRGLAAQKTVDEAVATEATGLMYRARAWARVSVVVQRGRGQIGLRLGPAHTRETCAYLFDRRDTNAERSAVVEVTGAILRHLPECKLCARARTRVAGTAATDAEHQKARR